MSTYRWQYSDSVSYTYCLHSTEADAPEGFYRLLFFFSVKSQDVLIPLLTMFQPKLKFIKIPNIKF